MKARLTSAIAAAAMVVPIATFTAAPALARPARPARVLLTLQVTDRAGHRVAPADAQVMNVASETRRPG